MVGDECIFTYYIYLIIYPMTYFLWVKSMESLVVYKWVDLFNKSMWRTKQATRGKWMGASNPIRKTVEKKFRLHPTHLKWRVSIPCSSERLPALKILPHKRQTHKRKQSDEKHIQNSPTRIKHTKVDQKKITGEKPSQVLEQNTTPSRSEDLSKYQNKHAKLEKLLPDTS